MPDPKDLHSQQTSDTKLVSDANELFKRNRARQIVAFFVQVIRDNQFKGMTHEALHAAFPAIVRMKWLEKRPDRRQQIMTTLVGLKPTMARKRDLAKQAQDIEDTLESKDISYEDFDNSFTPEDWAVHGDGEGIVLRFFSQFDWTDTKNPKMQAIVASFIEEFLRGAGGNSAESKPTLTHLQVRKAISSETWNQNLPLELRAKIDDARLEKEEKAPREPFTAKEELTLVPPSEFVKHILFTDLLDIFRAAIHSMGFKSPEDAEREKHEKEASANSTPTMAPPVAKATPPMPILPSRQPVIPPVPEKEDDVDPFTDLEVDDVDAAVASISIDDGASPSSPPKA